MYKSMCKDSRFVAGAGAAEIEVARRLQIFADSTPGLEQYPPFFNSILFVASLFPYFSWFSSPAFLFEFVKICYQEVRRGVRGGAAHASRELRPQRH